MKPSIVLKFNNSAVNAACANCGGRTDPHIGIECFVEGTWDTVCDECLQRYVPEMYAARELWRAAYAAYTAAYDERFVGGTNRLWPDQRKSDVGEWRNRSRDDSPIDNIPY